MYIRACWISMRVILVENWRHLNYVSEKFLLVWNKTMCKVIHIFFFFFFFLPLISSFIPAALLVSTCTFSFSLSAFLCSENRRDGGPGEIISWTITLSVLFIAQAHHFHWQTAKEKSRRATACAFSLLTDYPEGGKLREPHSEHGELSDQMRENMIISRRHAHAKETFLNVSCRADQHFRAW